MIIEFTTYEKIKNKSSKTLKIVCIPVSLTSVFGCNTSKQETIGMSPFECILSRKAIQPPDVDLQCRTLGISNPKFIVIIGCSAEKGPLNL